MYASLSYRSSSSILFILLLNVFVYIAAAPSTGDHGYGFLRLMNESFDDSTTTKLNHTVSQTYYLMNDDSIPIDVKDIAREQNVDVVLFGPGRIDLILENEALEFEVWQTCSGKSKVCYKSESGLIQSDAEGLCPDLTSYCGFDVSKRAGDPHHLKINTLSIEVDDGGHLSYAMKYDKVDVKKGQTFSSCTPKFGQNKEVQLYSYATRTCEITVKNAKIAVPPSTVSPSLGAESSDTVESANFFATTWGIVVITLIAVLLVLILLGIIGFFIGKKMNCFKSRKSVIGEEAIHQAKSDVVIIEGKKKAAEAQPRMDSKVNFKKAPVKKMVAQKPKKKNVANAPQNDELKPAKPAKESPLKTAVESKTDPTQDSSKMDDAPQPVIDENDYDENEVVPPPVAPAPPPPAVSRPRPARPHQRSTAPKKNKSRKLPQSPTKRYDNGRPYVQTPFKMFVRSGGSKKDSLCEKSGYF